MEQHTQHGNPEAERPGEFGLLLRVIRSRFSEYLGREDSRTVLDVQVGAPHTLMLFRLRPPDSDEPGYLIGIPVVEVEGPDQDNNPADPAYFAIKVYDGTTMDMDIIDAETYGRLETQHQDAPYADLMLEMFMYETDHCG